MSDNNQLSKRNEAGIERIKHYILSSEVRERFEDMMGKGAARYLNQVMSVVAQSPKLQECSPVSILVSAVRAASLRLSVDPAQGQAWIVPYKGTATFQIGWKGVYALAMRTNQYRYLNAFPVFEGETFIENRMTGIHKLGGNAQSKKVIGWGMAFELLNGFSKTYYMTVDEIAAHAEHYSQSYKYPNSPWNDPIERPKMEKKTVLSAGLRMFGVFNDDDKETLAEIEECVEWHDVTDLPDEDAVTGPEPEKLPDGMTRLEAMGYPPELEEDKRYELKNSMTPDEKLEVMANTLGVAKKQISDSLGLTRVVTLDTEVPLLLSWFGFYRSHRKPGKDQMTPTDAAGLANSEFQAWQGQQVQASFIDPQVGQP